MSKKMMLLALAVVSASMFALPGVAAAKEIHIEGITGFTGSAGPGTLAAEGEPTITCESGDVENGVVETGGTTGTMTLDFTGCHATVFGFTVKCHTSGSAKDNTIASGGTFHAITYEEKPAVLVTAATTEIICGGISNTHVEGDVIGTITSPACGVASSTMTVAFSATGSKQNHITYTGKEYDLKAKTSGSTQKTAGLTATGTLTATEGKKATLNCT